MLSGTNSIIQDSGIPSRRALLKAMFFSVGRSEWSKMISVGDWPKLSADSSRLVASSMLLHVYIVESMARSRSSNHRKVHWLSFSKLPGDEGAMKNMCPTALKITIFLCN